MSTGLNVENIGLNIEQFLANQQNFLQASDNIVAVEWDRLRQVVGKIKAAFPTYMAPWERKGADRTRSNSGTVAKIFQVLSTNPQQALSTKELVAKVCPENPKEAYQRVASQLSKYYNEGITVGGYKIERIRTDNGSFNEYIKVLV
jgi:hypothetical protein